MRKTAAVGTALSFAYTVGLAFVLDIFGGRAILAAIHPVASVAVPLIGCSILGGATICVIRYAREWDSHVRYKTIRELERMIDAGETYRHLRENYRASSTLPWSTILRWIVLAKKRAEWFSPQQDESGNPVPDEPALNRARRVVEVFRAYGYIRGRWKIRRLFKGCG
ncbi:MAG: hypothetical protein OXG13_09810 [Gemmatimonadaceae bacterium]|nr:hypothetical protein [Gemmatimonadaceae bacterium]